LGEVQKNVENKIPIIQRGEGKNNGKV